MKCLFSIYRTRNSLLSFNFSTTNIASSADCSRNWSQNLHKRKASSPTKSVCGGRFSHTDWGWGGGGGKSETSLFPIATEARFSPKHVKCRDHTFDFGSITFVLHRPNYNVYPAALISCLLCGQRTCVYIWRR